MNISLPSNITTQNRQESAHLNEIKGNIFEFRVGFWLAKNLSLSEQFLTNIPKQLSELLTIYQQKLFELDKDLFSTIDIFAKELAIQLFEYLKLKSPQSIELTGKIMAKNSLSNISNPLSSEVDLLIKSKDNSHYPISLKLSKVNAFINTKSAGAKSFFSKYFDDVDNFQTFFNEYIDQSYQQMLEELSLAVGMENHIDFNKNWQELGFSDRPGQVPKNCQLIIHSHYERLNLFFYNWFKTIFEKNKDLLYNKITYLAGLSSEELTQGIFLISKNSPNQVKIMNNKSFQNLLSFSATQKLIYNKNNIEFEFDSFKFQVRLKPMNKFTTPSLKVNCSVKFL